MGGNVESRDINLKLLYIFLLLSYWKNLEDDVVIDHEVYVICHTSSYLKMMPFVLKQKIVVLFIL